MDGVSCVTCVRRASISLGKYKADMIFAGRRVRLLNAAALKSSAKVIGFVSKRKIQIPANPEFSRRRVRLCASETVWSGQAEGCLATCWLHLPAICWESCVDEASLTCGPLSPGLHYDSLTNFWISACDVAASTMLDS